MGILPMIRSHGQDARATFNPTLRHEFVFGRVPIRRILPSKNPWARRGNVLVARHAPPP